MWVLVHIWIVQGWIERRNDHAVCRDGVVRGDREGLGRLVWNLSVKIRNGSHQEPVEYTIVTGGFKRMLSLMTARK
jgi:hypothetical protein